MSQQPAVKLDDLEEAMMFVSSGEEFGSAAWLCRDSGKVIWHADDGNEWDPLPENIDDEDRYVAIPDKRDLDLGKPLALEFARTHLPECLEQVYGMFSRRGAYARFKNLLERHQRLDAWYAREQERTRQALREWCADNGIKLAD